MSIRKKLAIAALPLADLMFTPLIYPAGLMMRAIRRAGMHRMPRCRQAFRRVGVFPVRDHYYEPQFTTPMQTRVLPGNERSLPGINWNADGQLKLAAEMIFANEIADLPRDCDDDTTFRLNNYSFSSGDAEVWYQMIRLKKPRRIIEIGSGHSTLMAAQAIRKNCADDPGYVCEHICIEPYEMPWLEKLGLSIIRRKVEDVDIGFFDQLRENDILFIDSSHVIRPEGDVLFEYLELLPRLASGVIVHVHDIFTPRNYPQVWLEDEVRLWNEQYLLEAFLTENNNWEVIGGLNWLHKNHFDLLKAVAPSLEKAGDPASFYMQRV